MADVTIPDVTALERSRADVRRGEPWLARDRLVGALRSEPSNQDVLVLLAEVHTELGDLPAAGACWFLTDRSDDGPAAEALAALRNRYRNPIALANSLPLKQDPERYPPAARHRIAELRAELAEAGLDWDPPGRPQPRFPRRDRLATVLIVAFWMAFGAANLAVYAVGLVTAFRWLR